MLSLEKSKKFLLGLSAGNLLLLIFNQYVFTDDNVILRTIMFHFHFGMLSYSNYINPTQVSCVLIFRLVSFYHYLSLCVC